MKISTTILLLLSYTLCLGQNNVFKLSTWKSLPLPTTEQLPEIDKCDTLWAVFNKHNETYAAVNRDPNRDTLPFKLTPTTDEEFYRDFRGFRSVIKVEDGFLVSHYRGEFGGSLYWFSSDGQSKKKVARTLIWQFLKRNGRIYAISGLDHMGMASGSVIELKKEKSDWTVSEVVRLEEDAPQSFTTDQENNFIIVTSNKILRVDKNNKITALLTEGFWDHLTRLPVTVAVQGDNAFLGMRKGVLKVNLKTGQQTWLLKDRVCA